MFSSPQSQGWDVRESPPSPLQGRLFPVYPFKVWPWGPWLYGGGNGVSLTQVICPTWS